MTKNGQAQNKVVLVTGAARGIGLATATAFLHDGYRVGVSDLDYGEARLAVAGLDADKDAIPLSMDVKSTEDVNACVAKVVERFGRLDALINVAGTTTDHPRPSQEEPDAEWARHLDTHLSGTFRCSRAAYPHLAATGSGAIVNVSSLAARLAMRQRVAYTSAKAGIEGLTRLLGVEWAPTGVRVNAVAPGYILTPRLEEGFRSGVLDEEVMASNVPQRRLGRAEEVASVILFLASDAASHVTGQTIAVDGGAGIDSRH
jgi:NAD(P)-dependent dehydrogenase (short-subunit alcohol dehydrogenase family)